MPLFPFIIMISKAIKTSEIIKYSIAIKKTDNWNKININIYKYICIIYVYFIGMFDQPILIQLLRSFKRESIISLLIDADKIFSQIRSVSVKILEEM